MSWSSAVRASFRHSSPSEEGEEGRQNHLLEVEIKARGEDGLFNLLIN